MKRLFITVLIGLVFQSLSFGQLTGVKFIPGDYATIALAIADLNVQGAGPGGVTFNVASGYSETFTSPTAGLISVVNTLASRPIVFQRDPSKGAGVNPKIYSAPGLGYNDYVICIGGGDYITFDGIDVEDAASNVAQPGLTEYGFVLAKSDPDGSGTQYAAVKNSTIKMKRSNVNSIGIVVRNWKCTALGTNGGVLDDPHKANSYNSFQGNTITDCFTGMYLMGGGTYEYYDLYNDIGSVEGNTITDFGHTSGECFGLWTQYENFMTIANNNINSVVPGGYCIGMEFQSSTNCSLNLYSNTISIQYLGTGYFHGIRDYMSNGPTAASNTVIIHDNVVTGCTFPRAEASTCTYMNIGHGGPNVSIYNNSVVNNQYGSDTTESRGLVNYLYVGYYPEGHLGSADIYNNTVSNNIRYQNPSGPGGGNTIYMRFGPQCNTLNVYGNVCDNNTLTTNGTAYGIDVSSLEPKIKNVYNNSVTNLHNANGTTYGMYISDGINWNIYKNKVTGIDGLAPTSVINGMTLGFMHESRKGNIFVYNNLIGDLRAGGSTSSTGVKGMVVYGGPNATQIGVFNNTIYLNASSIGADFGTAGLFCSHYGQQFDLRNNIVVNNSTPNGTGKTIAVLTDSLHFGSLALTSNNNNYYAGTPSAQRLIFSDGVNDDQTLLQYKTRFYPREYLSVTENSSFVSTTTPVDLHLSVSVPTQCESGGQAIGAPIAVTNDYDGSPRYPNPGYPVNPVYPATAPDIGADEIAGIPADLTPPFIDYAVFANTALTTDRVLTATITDAHGVPVSGSGLPVLYFKINSGLWTPVTGTFTGNNQYTFTFGGGVVQGDVVSYYLVSQDSWATPNIGASPLAGAGGYTANPPAVSVLPTTPNSYTIVAPICGTFTVGAGGNYTKLTDAINDINAKGLTCPVTLVLISNSYPGETFPVTLQPNGGSSSVNTLTIKPGAGKFPALGGGIAGNGVLKINGFDYLIIDGSATGGSDKSLTFRNVSETTGAHVIGIFNKNGNDPSTHITIKNCNIRGVSSVSVVNYGILCNSTGGGYDDITIMGNVITEANTGIQFTGNFNNVNHNGQIINNVIGSTDPVKYITAKGIVLQFADNTLVEGNDIMGPVNGNGVQTHAGVYILSRSTGTKVRKNLIHDFYRNVDDGSGAYGIWYDAENTSVTEFSNNSIFGIKSSGAAPGVAPNNPYGIFINGGGNIKIQHNSIWLYGDVLSTPDYRAGSSACIGILNDGSITNNIEVRNNILKNSMRQLTGLCPTNFSPGKTAGIATRATNAGNFSIIDNNDYMINGCSPQVGIMDNNFYPDIFSWRAATLQEANSITIDPVFTSMSNLVPTTTGMPKKGVYIPDVPTDIMQVTRTNPPDMGAYEFTPSPSVTTLAATGVTFTAATLNGTVLPANQDVNVFFDYGLTPGYGSTVTGTPPTVSGGSVMAVSATLSGLAENTTYHFRMRGVTFSNITIYGNDLTFTTPSSIPVNLVVPGIVITGRDTCYNALNTITVGGTSTFTVQPTGSVTFIAGVKILFLPGTTVLSGGYMHGKISDGTYCGASDAPMVASSFAHDPIVEGNNQNVISVFPNPTSGEFTLDFQSPAENRTGNVEIYNMMGERISHKEISGAGFYTFTLAGQPVGVYIIRVLSGSKTTSARLIKQ